MSKEIEMIATQDGLQSDLWELKGYFGNELSEKEKNLIGKVLTIVDASFTDQEQRKAVKDLVKNAFYGDSTQSEDYLERMFHQTLNLLNVWLRPTEVSLLDKVREHGMIDRYFAGSSSGACSLTPGVVDIFNK
jgi:hypothetical protein